MGTEILRPQDCLIERIRVSPCRRRNYYHGNGSFSASNLNGNYNARINRKPAVRSDRPEHQRKRSAEPSISKRSSSADDLKIKSNNNINLVMENVTILRRGESLELKIKASENTAAPSVKEESSRTGGDLFITGTARLGPGPEMVSKPVRIVDLRSPVAGNCDVYAGSAFAVSPAPSSLPLPSFSKKKQVSVDDSATRDLRRLLRLDF